MKVTFSHLYSTISSTIDSAPKGARNFLMLVAKNLIIRFWRKLENRSSSRWVNVINEVVLTANKLFCSFFQIAVRFPVIVPCSKSQVYLKKLNKRSGRVLFLFFVRESRNDIRMFIIEGTKENRIVEEDTEKNRCWKRIKSIRVWRTEISSHVLYFWFRTFDISRAFHRQTAIFNGIVLRKERLQRERYSQIERSQLEYLFVAWKMQNSVHGQQLGKKKTKKARRTKKEKWKISNLFNAVPLVSLSKIVIAIENDIALSDPRQIQHIPPAFKVISK